MQDRTSANSMKVLLQRTAGPYISGRREDLGISEWTLRTGQNRSWARQLLSSRRKPFLPSCIPVVSGIRNHYGSERLGTECRCELTRWERWLYST
jgi:hypothetical protein